MRKLLILVLLVLFPAALMAIPKGKELKYKSSRAPAANAKIIKQGIDNAVKGMSFITKPIAKSRLEKSNTAFETITVEQSGSKISISNDGRKPVVSPADGSKVKWTRPSDGETFDVSQKVSDNQIVQIFFAEDGKKTLTYAFNDDFSTLTLSVVVESPKLSGPLKYTLKYEQG